MIYLDNAATTIKKPKEVANAVKYAINNFGGAGRSFHSPAMDASRNIYETKVALSKLVSLDDPSQIAFTSSATESLNMVINGMIGSSDTVITSVAEHNSVLRPLYNTGCTLKFINIDKNGGLDIDSFEKLVSKEVKYCVITHGSNLTGNITDIYRLRELTNKYGIILIVDASQTIGLVPVQASMADVICFTGHKSLFGPQGVGGIICSKDISFKYYKVGGNGNTFDRFPDRRVPDVFEAGTLNVHSIYGLKMGIEFILRKGLDNIFKKSNKLLFCLYNFFRCRDDIILYGDFSTNVRLPIITLNLKNIVSSDLAFYLWDNYEIACRAGGHCAPLLHGHFDTIKCGSVRFSLSYHNTIKEINSLIDAFKSI